MASIVRLLLCIQICIIITGCASSQLVESIYNPYKGGTVKYLNQGADSVIRSRIKDANKKMKKFCEGDYEILRESSNGEFSGLVASQGMLIPMNSNYAYISFKCL